MSFAERVILLGESTIRGSNVCNVPSLFLACVCTYIRIYMYVVDCGLQLKCSVYICTRTHCLAVESPNIGHFRAAPLLPFVRRLSSLGGPKSAGTIGRTLESGVGTFMQAVSSIQCH